MRESYVRGGTKYDEWTIVHLPPSLSFGPGLAYFSLRRCPTLAEIQGALFNSSLISLLHYIVPNPNLTWAFFLSMTASEFDCCCSFNRFLNDFALMLAMAMEKDSTLSLCPCTAHLCIIIFMHPIKIVNANLQFYPFVLQPSGNSWQQPRMKITRWKKVALYVLPSIRP